MILLLLLVLLCVLIYEHYFPPIPKQKGVYPYALLLGCPCHDDGRLCTSAKKRCQRAIEAYQNHEFETLVITGGAVKNQYTESLAMKDCILKQCQMPILCETRKYGVLQKNHPGSSGFDHHQWNACTSCLCHRQTAFSSVQCHLVSRTSSQTYFTRNRFSSSLYQD